MISKKIKIRKQIIQERSKELLTLIKNFDEYEKDEIEIFVESINLYDIPCILNHLYRIFDKEKINSEREKEEVYHSVISYKELIIALKEKIIASDFAENCDLPQDFDLPFNKMIKWEQMPAQ